jgi:hypothetical protein
MAEPPAAASEAARDTSSMSLIAGADARSLRKSRRPRAKAPQEIPPLPVRKTEAGAAPPAPDVWPQSEIVAALAQCADELKTIDAVVEHVAPIKKGRCGTPAPIRLSSLGSGKSRVVFQPAALTNCRMAVALHQWLKNDLQPLAHKHLGARITTIEVMSDYSCRASRGRAANRLSEHAYVDALDIGGFVTEKGRAVRVLDLWGETQRDVQARLAAEAAAKKADAGKAAAAAAKSDSGEGVVAEAIAGNGEGAAPVPVSRRSALKLAATRLGSPAGAEPGKRRKASRNAAPRDAAPQLAALSPQLPTPAPPQDPGATFLRAAHAAACRIFGTTLGPEANEAHRNHFHVDMAERKYKKICD